MAEYPIKVFVGCAPNGLDAESQMVLESSMRSRCDKQIDIVWMMHSEDLNSFWNGWNSTIWKTPFSGFRWGIPEYCNFSGQAIYMDSDMIVTDDIDKLWVEPWCNGKSVMAATNSIERRTCVMKFNCKAMNDVLPKVRDIKANAQSHARLNKAIFDKGIVQFISKRWNNCEGATTDLGITHYTKLSTQPHLKYAIPRLNKIGMKHWYAGPINTGKTAVSDLFDTEYQHAISTGYTVNQYSMYTEVIKFTIIGSQIDGL